MDFQEFKKLALRTDYKTYDDFHTGAVSARLDYAALGLVTESAKILDIIKKSKKNKPLNKTKLLEELGDLIWYFNLFLDESDFDLETVLAASLEKINQKYPADDPEKCAEIRNVT